MSDQLAPPVPQVDVAQADAPALGAQEAAPSAPAPAAATGDVPLDANGQPLTKSALKRIQKEKDLAAKKALKNANKPAAGAQAGGAAPKKEKPVKKKEEAPAEPAYIEVPEGQKKGEFQGRLSGRNFRTSPYQLHL